MQIFNRGVLGREGGRKSKIIAFAGEGLTIIVHNKTKQNP